MQVSTEEALTISKRDQTASYRYCFDCNVWYKIPAGELARLKKRRQTARCSDCGGTLELATLKSLSRP